MFAPESTANTASSRRNPRRRQRTSLEDSSKPPDAKRQRSALRQEPSRPPTNIDVDLGEGNAFQPDTILKRTGNETRFGVEKNLAIRSSEKTSKPTTSRSDRSVILSSNDYYTVTRLPTGSEYPEDAISGPARCVFNSESGFALLLSDSRAVVWPYHPSTSQDPGLSVPIPEWCASDGEALMGTLVSNSTNTIPGLFIVAPSTGKLLYWETASNATVVGIAKQKQGGLQGSIPSLFYGEKVTDVVNAEPSGVVLTLSSGRVAQITFRDPQGKPALSVNFLQSTAKLAAGGLFHGIRSVLGSSVSRKSIAAVRAGNSLFRGQRDIIVASTSGLLEIWDSHWNGANSLRAEIDFHKDIFSFLELGDGNKHENSLRVLDLVAAHKETKLPSNSEEQPRETTLFILVVISRNNSAGTYAVVKAQLQNDNIKLLSSHILENVALTDGIEKQKPKLHVMEPWDTAFILIEQKLWILSLREIEPSPSAQLLDAVTSKPFQDRVQFQTGPKYEILGSGVDDTALQAQDSACILMVRGFGLIRISVTPSKSDSVDHARVTAKQKIEQAVFYGTVSNTPLSFSSDGEPTFTVPEFEEAALKICDEILRSTSPFISRGDISLDQNFRIRSKALSDLTAELGRRRIPLSQGVRWELMWAGEKLAAQRSMWTLEEGFQKKWNSETFLSRVISLMNDKFKTKYASSDNNSQNDRVRQWFVRDTFQMQHIIPWIFNTIRGFKGPSGRSGPGFLSQVYQASELSLTILEEAYRFREDHALQYGLGAEEFDNGVFLGSYTGIPEFWTSQNMVYNETIHMLDLELDSSRSWIQQSLSKISHADDDMLNHIGKNSCRRLHTLNKMLSERVSWLSAQDDPKLVDESISLKESSQKQRRWQLYKMAGIGELEGAITLAEEFRDVEALVELMIELQDQIKTNRGTMRNGLATVSPAVHNISFLQQKITGYFDSFGELWADAFFSRQISAGQPGVLLSMKDYQSHITQFLRKNPSYLPLRWINDVVGEEDYEKASDALSKLALDHDAKLWNQRVQLSLAKLTKLAYLEKTKNTSSNNASPAIMQKLDNRLEIGSIQDLTHEHILPALHSAIDQKAEIELAMEQFGNQIIDQPALRDLLEELMTLLISRQALEADQLINLLTLMDEVQFLEGEEGPVSKHEFYLALRVLRLSGYVSTDPVKHDFLLKSIWRRCIIRNDWRSISSTDFRSDSDRKSLYRNTALTRTLADCIAEETYFERSRGDIYPIPNPSDLMNLGSYELIRSRFRAEQWAHIERDMRAEIDLLRHHIDETKFEEWFPELILLAEEDAIAFNNRPDRILPRSAKAKFSWV